MALLQQWYQQQVANIHVSDVQCLLDGFLSDDEQEAVAIDRQDDGAA